MEKVHGRPCWYELATGEGGLGAAGAFYGEVFGWEVEDAGMEDVTYHLARSGGDLVAGMMEMPPDAGDMSPFWMIYFAVDSADRAVSDLQATGGSVFRGPAEIPGTGRFAVVADPQGAAFGILQPVMAPQADGGHAFDQGKAAHGAWNELMTSDPEAAWGFYNGLLGWTKGQAVDMGEMGTYQTFAFEDAEIGGMMQLGAAPRPAWLPYFGVDGVTAAMARIEAAGGRIAHGPLEVPGGAFIAAAQDPQGAWFAVVGPREAE